MQFACFLEPLDQVRHGIQPCGTVPDLFNPRLKALEGGSEGTKSSADDSELSEAASSSSERTFASTDESSDVVEGAYSCFKGEELRRWCFVLELTAEDAGLSAEVFEPGK